MMQMIDNARRGSKAGAAMMLRKTARILASLAILWAVPGAASAQTEVLVCPFLDGHHQLVTLDYGAQTFTADELNRDGTIARMAYQRLPAEITDEQIVAMWRHENPQFSNTTWLRFRFDRYALTLTRERSFGPEVAVTVSQPCRPYRRGQRPN